MDLQFRDIDGVTKTAFDDKNLPVGTIWMYAGSGTWVDNVTIPGWYACIAANSAFGVPDLEDHFVAGGTTGTVGTSIPGARANLDITVTLSNLPSHCHSTSHCHIVNLDNNTHNNHSVSFESAFPLNTAGSHCHTYTYRSSAVSRSLSGSSSRACSLFTRCTNSVIFASHNCHSHPAMKGGSHSHNILTASASSFNSVSFGNGCSFPAPKRFRVIYIKKVS